jgi:2,5-diamino-6-(ribosylamino)-4(3H)-pyrimidinone 5'-phosphate reductase
MGCTETITWQKILAVIFKNSEFMKPYIITHMAASLDGRILVEHWGDVEGRDEYERTARQLEGDAWMVGRITMERHFAAAKPMKVPTDAPAVDRTDYVATHDSVSYAVVVDPSGKLNYEKADVDGDHIIALLTGKVPDSYLQALQARGISYIFGGTSEIDFVSAVEKLSNLFFIKRLLLEGGGVVNGSLLDAGVVDEISILQYPIVDGTFNTPSVFDIKKERPKPPAARLTLVSAEKISHDILWVRYKVSMD